MSLLRKMKARVVFSSVALQESRDNLNSPGCGWYHIHSFALDREVDFRELYWCLCKEETLALVLLDIGAYRRERLPEEALVRMRRLLDFFAEQGKELIVRIVYDREGRGMEREPDAIGLVEAHMRQTGTLLREYANHILLVQGLFVGSWGELHSSKFLSKEKLKRLEQTLREALGKTIPMAVRKPVQWRMLYPPGTLPDAAKLGLFDDGMFGSASNLGTYGTAPRECAGWEVEWRREDELEFIGGISKAICYGGEAVGTDPCGELSNAVAELRLTEACYLNGAYDEQLLRRWKESVWREAGIWDNCSGYDYIGCHLGYRFVIREISFRRSIAGRREQGIAVRIENVGFSTLKDEAELSAVWKSERSVTGGSFDSFRQVLLLPEDLREVCPGGSVALWIPLPGQPLAEPLSLFLQLKRKKDGRSLRFANKDARETVKLGLLSNR